MALPPIYRAALDGTEMLRVLVGGRWYMASLSAVAAAINAPLLARLAALEKADAAQALRDAGQDAALSQEGTARAAADATAGGRLAVLEARPEEVAHFTGTGKFPTVAIGASFTLVLAGLTPARIGDVLKAGEQVDVWPTGTVPAGVTFGRPTVTADNTVALPCSAGLTIAGSAAPVPFALAALR